MNIYLFDLDDTLYDSTGRANEEDWNIQAFPEAIEILRSLQGRRILVTRGSEDLQNKKIDVLGLRPYFEDIYIVPSDEGKLEAFRNIKEAHAENNFVVIGNRIDVEIRYGNKLLFQTIFLKHGKHASRIPRDDFEKADHEIMEFNKIKHLI